MNEDDAVEQARDVMEKAYDITVDHCLVPMKTRRVKKENGVFGYYVSEEKQYDIKYEVDGGEVERSRFEKMQIAIAAMINNNLNVVHMMRGEKKKPKPIVYDPVEEQKLNLEMDKAVEDGTKEVEEARKKL